MNERFEKVLDLIKTRGVIPTGTSEMIVISYITQANLAIKAYCNIPEKAPMPDGLFFTWVDVATELCSAATRTSKGVISAIKEGDTTIEYQSVPDHMISSVLDAYRSTLNRYRRLA